MSIPQEELVQRFQQLLLRDSHVLAVWLEGSLGRGTADRYSDLDLHVLLHPDAPDLTGRLEEWIEPVARVVFNKPLFGEMHYLITDQGLRVDLWLQHGVEAGIDRSQCRVLKETPGSLIEKTDSWAPDNSPETLLRNIMEFWRCIHLLPCVLGRDELIVAFVGIGEEIRLLWDVLIRGRGIPQQAGVKNLNRRLCAEDRAALESLLPVPELSRAALARTHLRMAALMSLHGPTACARAGVDYPTELEEIVLGCVRQELQEIGLET